MYILLIHIIIFINLLEHKIKFLNVNFLAAIKLNLIYTSFTHLIIFYNTLYACQCLLIYYQKYKAYNYCAKKLINSRNSFRFALLFYLVENRVYEIKF